MRAMRTQRSSAARLAVGAIVLACPATAMAVTTSGASAPTSPTGALHATRPAAPRYGHDTVVRGTAPASAAGSAVALEYRPADSRRWRVIARGHVHRSGHFHLGAPITRSGSFQVVALPSGAHAAGSPALTTAGASAPDGAAASNASVATAAVTRSRLQASRVQHLTVKPKLTLARRSIEALVGRPVHVRGRLLPGVSGRRVVLDVRRGARWVPAAHGRTRRSGAFDVSYQPTADGPQRVRVLFPGDPLNARARSAAEAVSPMEYAEVSWYEDAGNTACGFHATYGIASRTLPCGTHVTMSYGGRSVTATVDDRGPFVYSRLYDLNQNVAGRLGMYGVATVLASV